jgi:hypothetical protein
VSPYPALSSLPHVANEKTFAPFVYPPPAAFAMVPLSALPFHLAAPLWFVFSIGIVALSLRLLGVTDWRVYGASFLSVPVLSGLALGTLNPLLLLGVVVAWRWRDRAVVAGVAVAAVIVAKLFLWPLGVWLLLTRRYRAAAVAAAVGTVSTLGTWALLGFAGLRDYPALLERMTALVGANSFSLYALGLPQVAGLGLAVALMVALRRRSDETILVGALGAALASSPILWGHYLILLVVPLVFASRQFSPIWLVPCLMWLDFRPWSYGHAGRILPDVATMAAVLCAPALARYARSASRTSSAWLSGFTLCITRLTVPSSAITNVERLTPM